MKRFFGVAKQPKPPQNLGRKRFDMPRAVGTGFHLTGNEYNRHLNVIITRLSEYPAAVDALLFVITKILEKPSDNSRKQVNLTKAVFHKTIGKSGKWGIRLLEALGFVKTRTGEYYNLHRRNENLNKLRLAQDKLKTAQKSEVYSLATEKILFSRQVASLLVDESDTESASKINFLSNIPPEPREGSAGNTNVRVYFGEADIQRRFASDNTLQNVLDWVCASLHSTLIQRIKEGEYELIDRTVFPPKLVQLSEIEKSRRKSSSDSSAIDLFKAFENADINSGSENKTLQIIGLWPSGEVEIQKAGFLKRERALIGVFKED